jgi:iron complex transport system substrate-binding protein
MTRPTPQLRPRHSWIQLGLALWLAVVWPLTAAERPQRVVSVNLCSDQLLLMLADADQVASVSHLAVEPLSSFVAERARDYPLNHARAEEVIALRPDLVLASAYGNLRLLTTLESLGYRLERLPPAHDLSQIVQNIRQLASLLHQSDRGEALIRTLQSRLSNDYDAPQDKRPGALFLQPRGYTSGRETLQDEALRLAGWRNLAAEQGIEGYAPVDLERLLRWQPQQIFTSIYDGSGNSLAQRQLLHPALTRLLAGRPLEPIPYKYWICPGPMLAEAVELLRQARNELKPPQPNADTTP